MLAASGSASKSPASTTGSGRRVMSSSPSPATATIRTSRSIARSTSVVREVVDEQQGTDRVRRGDFGEERGVGSRSSSRTAAIGQRLPMAMPPPFGARSREWARGAVAEEVGGPVATAGEDRLLERDDVRVQFPDAVNKDAAAGAPVRVVAEDVVGEDADRAGRRRARAGDGRNGLAPGTSIAPAGERRFRVDRSRWPPRMVSPHVPTSSSAGCAVGPGWGAKPRFLRHRGRFPPSSSACREPWSVAPKKNVEIPRQAEDDRGKRPTGTE